MRKPPLGVYWTAGTCLALVVAGWIWGRTNLVAGVVVLCSVGLFVMALPLYWRREIQKMRGKAK